MVKILALAVLLALAACQASKGSFCALSEARRPSAATIATMTDAEVKRDLAHNELGQRLCGWKP